MPVAVSGYKCVVCNSFFDEKGEADAHEEPCLARKLVRDAIADAKRNGGGWRIEKVREECPHPAATFDGWGQNGDSNHSCPDCGHAWIVHDQGR